MGRKKRKQKSIVAGATTSSTSVAANHHTTTTSKADTYSAVVGTNFEIDIPEQHFEKLMFLCNKGLELNTEVSGLASCAFDGRTFTLGEPFMCKQTGSASETEMDPAGMGKLMYLMREQENPCKVHWHTHPRMSTFWSGTDMNLIRQLGSQGWMVYLVLNEKREVRGAFYNIVEVMGNKHEIFVDDIPVNILTEVDEEVQAKWAEEFESTYEKKSYAPYLPGRDTYNRYPMFDQIDFMEQEDSYGANKLDDWRSQYSRFDYEPYMGWDREGYRYAQGKWMYNPLKDKTLNTDLQRVEEMHRSMEPEDIESLYKTDKEFAAWYMTVQAAGLA